MIGQADSSVDDVQVHIAQALEALTVEPVANGVLASSSTLAVKQLRSTHSERRSRSLREVDASHGTTPSTIAEAFDELTTLIFLLASLFLLPLPLFFLTATLLQLAPTSLSLLSLEAFHPKRSLECRCHSLDVRDCRLLIEKRLEYFSFRSQRHLLMTIDQRAIDVDTTCRDTNEAVEAIIKQMDCLGPLRDVSRIRIEREVHRVVSDHAIADEVAFTGEAKLVELGLDHSWPFSPTPANLEAVPRMISW